MQIFVSYVGFRDATRLRISKTNNSIDFIEIITMRIINFTSKPMKNIRFQFCMSLINIIKVVNLI